MKDGLDMKFKKRYPYWKILSWVVLFYAFVFLLFVITIMISVSNKEAMIRQFWNANNSLNILISTVFYSFFFYFSLNVFYQLISRRSHFTNYAFPIVVGMGIHAFEQSLMFLFLKRDNLLFTINGQSNTGGVPVALMLFSYLIISIFFIIVALLIAYFTHLRDEGKQRKVLEAQKLQLEIEKTQANYNFLKAQINPHFLHNTLSYLYVKSLSNAPELPEGILTLSDIMRYALGEGNTNGGKATLKDEIEHLSNVIKINQLRFSNKLNVKFKVEGVINGAQIIPFVLITLVENAFKHGDLKSTEFPITIRLKLEDKRFYFYTHNKKKTGPKELSTGIGLDNIKKRLDMAYGKNHKFEITDEIGFYTTELTIYPL